MDELKNTFHSWFVLVKSNDVISLGTITSLIFVAASLLLIKRYLANKQGLSEVITSGTITTTYLLGGIVVDYIRPIIVNSGIEKLSGVSVVYLLFSLLLIASLISIYLLHKTMNASISPLFSATIGVFSILSVFNLSYWIRMEFLGIVQTDLPFNYAYWFASNYLSFALALACFFPALLVKKAPRAFINPLSLAIK